MSSWTETGRSEDAIFAREKKKIVQKQIRRMARAGLAVPKDSEVQSVKDLNAREFAVLV